MINFEGSRKFKKFLLIFCFLCIFSLGFLEKQIVGVGVESRAVLFLKELENRNSNAAVFFLPDGQGVVKRTLLDLIELETEKLNIATFRFTNRDILDAVIHAHERGVFVEIVGDCGCLGGRFSKLRKLHARGIPVFVYPDVSYKSNYSLMHNKFIIFHNLLGRALVITGSANLTNAAFSKNRENIFVFMDRKLVAEYMKEFENLKVLSTKL